MPGKKYFGEKCRVRGCPDYAESNWMCHKHDQRNRRWGDPNYLRPELQRRATNRIEQLKNVVSVKPTTYRKRFGRHEHRVIAEEKLGRPLRRGEIVHHIDGDRHNNSPDNLQIMTQSEHINMHREEMQRARSSR